MIRNGGMELWGNWMEVIESGGGGKREQGEGGGERDSMEGPTNIREGLNRE